MVKMKDVMEFAEKRKLEAQSSPTPAGKDREFFCSHDVDRELSCKGSEAANVLRRCVENGGLVRLNMKSRCKYSSTLHWLYRLNKSPEVMQSLDVREKKVPASLESLAGPVVVQTIPLEFKRLELVIENGKLMIRMEK